MRNYKFALLCLVILLAGAVAAAAAAHGVVAPQADSVVCAGVRAVPSVLGQTAEDVQFPPWPLYELESLSPLPESVAEYAEYNENLGQMISGLLDVFTIFGVRKPDAGAAREKLLWNGSPDGAQLFLKDLDAALSDGTPVSVSFACVDSYPQAVSWIVRPREAAALSSAQRQAALDAVAGDFYDFITAREPPYPFSDSAQSGVPLYIALLYPILAENELSAYCDLLEEWVDALFLQYLNDAMAERGALEEQAGESLSPEAASAALEELLSRRDSMDVQLISTPTQIVLLFTLSGEEFSGGTIGIFYDIALARYAGIGFSC